MVEGTLPEAPCSRRGVYKVALEGLLYHHFGVHVCAILLLGALGNIQAIRA